MELVSIGIYDSRWLRINWKQQKKQKKERNNFWAASENRGYLYDFFLICCCCPNQFFNVSCFVVIVAALNLHTWLYLVRNESCLFATASERYTCKTLEKDIFFILFSNKFYFRIPFFFFSLLVYVVVCLWLLFHSNYSPYHIYLIYLYVCHLLTMPLHR